MTGLFYPQHLLYVHACDSAFSDCLRRGRLQEASEYGELCIASYKKSTFFGHIWNDSGLLSLRLGAVYSEMGMFDEADNHLAYAQRILTDTHGEEHDLMDKIKSMRNSAQKYKMLCSK